MLQQALSPSPRTPDQVFFVEEADTFNLALKIGQDGGGQGGNAIFFTLTIANIYGFVFKVNVFHTQAHTLYQAQSRAIQNLRHEFMHSTEFVDNAKSFFMSQTGWETFGAFCAGE